LVTWRDVLNASYANDTAYFGGHGPAFYIGGASDGRFVNRTGDTMTGDLNISSGDAFVNISASGGGMNISGNVTIDSRLCFDNAQGACLSDARDAGNPGEMFLDAESIIVPDYLDWFFCSNDDGSGEFSPYWQVDCSGAFIIASDAAAHAGSRTLLLSFADDVTVNPGNLSVAGNISSPNAWLIGDWLNATYIRGTEMTLTHDATIGGDLIWSGIISGDVGWGNLTNVPDVAGYGDIFVNAWLVESGYAQVLTIPPNVRYAERFLGLQREAREEGRGLWEQREGDIQKESGSDTTTVFVTKTGKKYHRKDCHYLRYSRIPVTLREAVLEGYEPCKVCRPPLPLSKSEKRGQGMNINTCAEDNWTGEA